jgi:hypothetical protein
VVEVENMLQESGKALVMVALAIAGGYPTAEGRYVR